MKKLGKLLLTAAFVIGFCFSAFAANDRTPLPPEVNVNITHDGLYSAGSFSAVTDTANCYVDKCDYDTNQNILSIYMRTTEGFRFATTKRAQIHLNEGHLYKGKRADSSTTLVLRVAFKNNGTWGEDKNGKFFTRLDGSRVNSGWYYMPGEPYEKDGVMQYPVNAYYFTEAGYMLTNANTPDGYYIGADGIWRNVILAGTTDSME